MAATLGHWFELEIGFVDAYHGDYADADLKKTAPISVVDSGDMDTGVRRRHETELFDSHRVLRVKVTYKKKVWCQDMRVPTIVLDKINVWVDFIGQFKREISVKTTFINRIKTVVKAFTKEQ